MALITITGLLNGSGASTLAANFCCSLSGLGKKVILVDLDQRNFASSLLGNPITNFDGWAYQQAYAQDWSNSYYISPNKLPFIPFGDPYYGVDDDNIAFLKRNKWSKKKLYRLDTPLLNDMLSELTQQFDYIVLVMPSPTLERNAEKLLQSINEKVDLQLMAVNPDARSYALLHHYFNMNKLSNTKIVLNNYISYSQLQQDFVLLYKEEMTPYLAPSLIHQDMVMLEAAAKQTTVRHYSPESQATKDYNLLALWAITHLNKYHV
jgi:cellulose synthase operon protein YhjQ